MSSKKQHSQLSISSLLDASGGGHAVVAATPLSGLAVMGKARRTKMKLKGLFLARSPETGGESSGERTS